MAKRQEPKKTTTMSPSKGRTLTNKNGNFSVTQNKKAVKPTSSDTATYNKVVKGTNDRLSKAFKKPLLADTLKKKK